MNKKQEGVFVDICAKDVLHFWEYTTENVRQQLRYTDGTTRTLEGVYKLDKRKCVRCGKEEEVKLERIDNK